MKPNQLKFGTLGHIVKHKWDTFDLVAFDMIWGLVHLFVIHDNILTAVVIVIKQIIKAHVMGLLFPFYFFPQPPCC